LTKSRLTDFFFLVKFKNMDTITIPRTEYKKLKKYSSAYLRIVEEITEAERDYPYDYHYIGKLTRQTKLDYKKGRTIEADSVDEALAKFHKK